MVGSNTTRHTRQDRPGRTRMLVLGAQVLLGFEFSGVFRDGFERLPLHARYLDGIALLLLILTVALLITSETYHHMVEVGRDTGRFHQLISRMVDCALLPFALSLGLALFIAGKAFSVSRPGWQPAYFTSFSLSDAGTASNICAGCEPVIGSGQPRRISRP